MPADTHRGSDDLPDGVQLPRVERAFLAVHRSHASVNFTRIARHRGWSAWVGGATYRRLAARGERLPPLRTQPVEWGEEAPRRVPEVRGREILLGIHGG